MEDVDLGLKIPATLIFKILYKWLMVIGEFNIGLIPDTLPPITQVNIVDCCVYLFLIVVFMILFISMKDVIAVVMIEAVYLGLKIPTTLSLKIL